MMRAKNHHAPGIIAIACAMVFVAAVQAWAADVKMRLIRNDASELKVSTAVTEIDIKAEREAAQAEAQVKAAAAVSTKSGGQGAAKDADVKPPPMASCASPCSSCSSRAARSTSS